MDQTLDIPSRLLKAHFLHKWVGDLAAEYIVHRYHRDPFVAHNPP
ncbi:MAG: hypothetical protein ACFCU9_14890 [Cyanophyceae cyanobacterium]